MPLKLAELQGECANRSRSPADGSMRQVKRAGRNNDFKPFVAAHQVERTAAAASHKQGGCQWLADGLHRRWLKARWGTAVIRQVSRMCSRPDVRWHRARRSEERRVGKECR